jgi:hypothetical protein
MLKPTVTAALLVVVLAFGAFCAGAQASPIKISPSGAISVEAEGTVSYVTSVHNYTYKVEATIERRMPQLDGSVKVYKDFAVLKYRSRPCGNTRVCYRPFYARQSHWIYVIPAPKVSGGTTLSPTGSDTPPSSGGVSLSDIPLTGGVL